MELLEKSKLVLLLIFFYSYGCGIDNGQSLRNKIKGTWITPKGNTIQITEQDYIVEGKNGNWKYKVVGDSLISIYDSPFDTSPLLKILSIQKDTIKIYDSLFFEEMIFIRK